MSLTSAHSPRLRGIGALILGAAWATLFLSFGGVSGIARGTASVILSVSLIVQVLSAGIHPTTARAMLGLVPLALPAIAALIFRLALDSRSEATVGWLIDLAAIGCVFILSAEWTRRSKSLRMFARGLMLLGVVVASVPLAHLLIDERALFGLFPGARPTGPGTLPLINPNHTAALSNLLLAPALVLARWPLTHTTWERALAVCCALMLTTLTLATQSTAGIIILGGVWLAVGMRETPWRVRVVLATAVVPIAASLSLFVPAWGHYAGGARLTMWRAALAMWRDHPWLGVGPGNFGAAVSPYRTDSDFADWVHAHNEWVQWLSETGIVGVVCLAAAAAWLLPGLFETRRYRRQSQRLRWAVLVGLAGLGAHSIVDFPLRITAITWLGAALLGALVSLGTRSGAPLPRSIHSSTFALTLAMLALLGAPLLIGTGLADRAELHIGTHTDTASLQDAVNDLERIAPWRPTVGQGRIVLSQRQGGTQEAFATARAQVQRWPESQAVLRAAATVAAANGHFDQAEAWVDRALTRAHYDWRLWVLKARLRHTRADVAGTVACWARAFESDAPISLIEEATAAVPLPVLWLDPLTEVHRVSVLVHFARWFGREGAFQEAALTWDLIRWREPNYVEGRTEYLTALIKAGRAEDAAEHALRAVEAGVLSRPGVRQLSSQLQPTHTDLALEVVLAAAMIDASLRADAVLLLNHVEGADAALQKASQWFLQAAADASLHRAVASVHRANGDVDRCTRALVVSRSLQPVSVSVPSVGRVCGQHSSAPIEH